MKQLTTEFQKQMNGLIQRLVQENFEQLNKSVERLNSWQQENKNMIASLIQQYKDMETDFEIHLLRLPRCLLIPRLGG